MLAYREVRVFTLLHLPPNEWQTVLELSSPGNLAENSGNGVMMLVPLCHKGITL